LSVTEKQLSVITRLSELEESIGHLYETYAINFPDYRNFWVNMASDEHEHSAWVANLRSLIDNHSVVFSGGRFKLEAIQTFQILLPCYPLKFRPYDGFYKACLFYSYRDTINNKL
jgi:hypothetical protein